MSTLTALLHEGARTAGIAGLLYACTVTAAALTALLARTSVRRGDARAVLKILLRGRDTARPARRVERASGAARSPTRLDRRG